jgi:hypothetical protein
MAATTTQVELLERTTVVMLFLPNSEKRKEWGDTGNDHLQIKDMHAF